MPIATFEVLSCLVIVVTLFGMAKREELRKPPGSEPTTSTLLADYLSLAVAGFLGEETCIVFYRYYTYADSWHFRLHHVPLLVPLIWPLVILSARDAVTTVWPPRPSGGALPPTSPAIAAALRVGLSTGAVVVFDAALIEVLSVRAGYWWWAEPGHLGVPIIGILGWGFFAAPAMVLLSTRYRYRHLALLVVAPLATHALLLLTWWGFFRWFLRRDLGGVSLLGLGFVSLVAATVVLLRGRPLPLVVAAPRLAATALFVVVFWLVASDSTALWICLGAAALPYLVSMIPRGAGPEEPDRASPEPPRAGGDHFIK
jgi:hypothetical protein